MTVLFAPETFNLAETTRGIEVARALRDRHECVFMGYSERYADLVRSAGFRYHASSPALTDQQADQLLRVDQGKGVRHPFDTATVRARVRTELALIEDVGAEAVVIGTTLTQFLSARIAGVPLVYVKPFAYSPPHLSSAQSVPVLPGRHRLGRAVNAAAPRALRGVTSLLTYKPRSFRAAAAEYGAGLPRRTIDLLEADLNLVTSSTVLLDDHELPPDYRAVGPVFARLDGEVPDGVLRAVAAARTAGLPVVYAAMGSSGNRRLVLRVLRALSAMPVAVVAPVRHFLHEADVEGLGEHVHVCDLVPAHDLGGLVDAAVIHGGEGTVQTAVATGLPFVGIGLQMEQRWNIDDGVRRGTAVRVTPRDVGRHAFTRAVHTVVTDLPTRRRARALAARLAGVDGAARAADAIHELITRRTPDPLQENP